MKPDSIQQMKRYLEARDLLYGAVKQYVTSLGTLKRALDYVDVAMVLCRDNENEHQICRLRELVEGLSHTSVGTVEAFRTLTETLEVLANEVTVREEHVPAGVS